MFFVFSTVNSRCSVSFISSRKEQRRDRACFTRLVLLSIRTIFFSLRESNLDATIRKRNRYSNVDESYEIFFAPFHTVLRTNHVHTDIRVKFDRYNLRHPRISRNLNSIKLLRVLSRNVTNFSTQVLSDREQAYHSQIQWEPRCRINKFG